MNKTRLWLSLLLLASGLLGAIFVLYLIGASFNPTPNFLYTGLITFILIYLIGLIHLLIFLIDNFADEWENDLKQINPKQGDNNAQSR